MKILHTADWHIGQYFFGYNRSAEHTCFFEWLKNTIIQLQVDVLLVAGDIFDTPNPSAESQKIYYKFLKEVTAENQELQIIITAGNHDSAARLEAPNPLLEEMNVHVKGLISKNIDGEIKCNDLFIPLTQNGETKAWCIAVPYLRQGDYPNAESYAQGVHEMYELLYQKIQTIKSSSQPIIYMGHLQTKDSQISDNDKSERTIIGGLEAISSEIFQKSDIAYTALGHLHRAQSISGKENIRYAGSPLPMSFSERKYKQGVYLIEIEKNKLDKIERVDFTPPVQLVSLPKEPKRLNEVLKEIENLPDGEIQSDSPYLELKVLMTEPEPSMRNQIEEALKNKSVRLASAVAFKQKRDIESKTITYEELKTINPMEMAEDIFLNRYGDNMPEKMKELLQYIIQEVQA